ncbi:MAG: efflux RND transporter periplasmic adaptor subunit [Kangiellaceae bacterium]|nr:efflux RND transporter periplasmic adaptor subunit [Kangiellaceae bacterium]
MQNRQPYLVFVTTLFFLVSLLLSGCGEDDGKGAGKRSGKFGAGKPPTKVIPVEVTSPQIGLAASFYVTTATLEPSSDAKVNSRTTGVVKQLLHEEGDDVYAGDVLLILDDDDQRLKLKQAKQKFDNAKREFDRLNRMRKTGAVSNLDFDAANNTYQSAITDKEIAELTLSYTRVAAPFDGRVVWRDVDLGAHVAQGDLLFRMMSIKPLLVRVHIPANRLGMVAKGQTVQLIVDSVAKELVAKVDLVSPIVDPTTGTIKITLRLDDYPLAVRPGDFTEVHMVTDQHQNALLVPSNAIIEERGNHFLYTVSNNKAQRRPVESGFVMSANTEIISGIEKNDLVVIKGQRNLNDDIAVDVLTADKLANKATASENPALTAGKEAEKRRQNSDRTGDKKRVNGNKKRGEK